VGYNGEWSAEGQLLSSYFGQDYILLVVLHGRETWSLILKRGTQSEGV
jgi:hypothetical protein